MRSLVLIVSAFLFVVPVLYLTGKWLTPRFFLWMNTRDLIEASNTLIDLYYGKDDLSDDEKLVLELVLQLESGQITFSAEDKYAPGHHLIGEDEVIVIPLYDFLAQTGMEAFVTVFLASELVFSVCHHEGFDDMGTVGKYMASLRHWEIAIRCFIRLQQEGETFDTVPSEVLEEWLDEAYFYNQDQEAWTVRTNAQMVHRHPEFAEVIAAASL